MAISTMPNLRILFEISFHFEPICSLSVNIGAIMLKISRFNIIIRVAYRPAGRLGVGKRKPSKSVPIYKLGTFTLKRSLLRRESPSRFRALVSNFGLFAKLSAVS